MSDVVLVRRLGDQTHVLAVRSPFFRGFEVSLHPRLSEFNVDATMIEIRGAIDDAYAAGYAAGRRETSVDADRR